MSEITDIVIAEMQNLVCEGVSDEELQLQKDQARASILLDLEDSASRAGSIAQSELVHGRQISVEETLANLEAVTCDDINAVAQEFFRTETIAFAALGNLDGLKIDRGLLSLENK